jgi:hypothetical protein
MFYTAVLHHACSSALWTSILSCWVRLLCWQEFRDKTFLDKKLFKFARLVHCVVSSLRVREMLRWGRH